MARRRYWITPTAKAQFNKILKDTRARWGTDQARRYAAALQSGFQQIADSHPSLRSPHRDELAQDSPLSVHRVEHHYVAFQAHSDGHIIIAGIFHEKMDIPRRLQDFRNITSHELRALKRQIDRERLIEGRD
jgi:plasmid stabilization system protein ParE